MNEEQEFKNAEDAMSYISILTKPIKCELPPLSLYKPKPKEIVAGGDPIRTPVDRVAARVVAPAPDWAKPPPPPATKAIRPTKSLPTMKTDDGTGHDTANDHMSQSPEGNYLLHRKKQADFDVEIADAGAKKFAKNVEDSENLVRRAEEAAAAIEYLVTHVRKNWVEYDDFIINALKKARATKVAIEIETKQTLAALGDVRKFFLDDRHTEEVQRLKEFVELCERLRALKSSGFLDVVADTILKLA